MLGTHRRLAILAEGRFTPLDAKTAVGVLRYRPEQVAAILDSGRAGRTAQACVGVGGETPVVATLDEAAAHGAGALLIGIAPQGGELPDAWRPAVRGAIERGWTVFSGLHVFLADDPELAPLAAARGATLVDVRRPPPGRPVAAGRAARVPAYVVLTVGTDCNVGKMTAALEISAALRAAGERAEFVATGQTGMLISGRGAAVDAVVADFAAGVTEALVLDAAREADWVVVEGQGSLFHPGYSGVTLSLLHGACPSAMVLVHEAGRDAVRTGDPSAPPRPLPPLDEACRAYERAAAWMRPAPVVAVAMHTAALGEPEARAACERAARDSGRPAADPVRFGAGPLVAALRAARAQGGTRAAVS